MIISKTERYANELALALRKLQCLVDTDARSAEARANARRLRSQAIETGICPYCGNTANVWSVRHTEACAACGARLDRMLMTKSRIKSGAYASDMLSKFKEDYLLLNEVPYSLGGSSEQAELIIQAIDELLVASAANNKAKLQAQRQRTQDNIRNKRMNSIRNDLVLLGASRDDKDFEDRVLEVYYSRYTDF